MKIENYISELLFDYQCVTIPGFGAFLAESKSAFIDSNLTFVAPNKQISFNSYIKNNDGLLANYIASKENLSYENALATINQNVADWKETLSLNMPILLKNIGILKTNHEGNLQFIPSDAVNYQKKSFGLYTYSSPLIKREIIDLKIKEQISNDLNTKTPNRRLTYLKYAASVIVGFGTLALIGNAMYNRHLENEQNLVQAEALKKEIKQNVQTASFSMINTEPKTDSVAVVKKMNFHIIAGSFKSKKNADRVYENLIKLGFEAKILPTNEKGLLPIAFGSYATSIEAEQALKKIKEDRFEEAWILEKEL